MYLNRVTLTGFNRQRRRKENSGTTTLVIFSMARRCPGRMIAESGNRVRSGIAYVPFGEPADFAGSLKKGAHVAIEGELRSHDYGRGVVFGSAKTTVTQRGWEIRVGTLLKLDQAARGEESTDTTSGEPQ